MHTSCLIRLARILALGTTMLLLAACTEDKPPAEPAKALKEDVAAEPAPVYTPAEFKILGPVHDPTMPDPMQGQLWRLKTALDADGQRLRIMLTKSGMPISLIFANGRVSIRNSCNHMSSDYRVGDDGQISIPALQQTEKNCIETGAMEAEAELIRLLHATRTASVSTQSPLKLELTTEQGEKLQFDAIPLPNR